MTYDEADKCAPLHLRFACKGGGCLIAGLAGRGGLGAGHHPHGWAGARGERQAVTEAMPGGAARPGRGGPTLSRAAVLQPLPSQALLSADDTFAATDATTGRHGDRQPRFAGMAMAHPIPSGRDHPAFLWLFSPIRGCLEGLR